MELTANRRPFLYFPLRHHFEQNFHVAHRLDRYRAGHRMDYTTSDPDAIAAAIAAGIGRAVDFADRWRPTAPPGPPSSLPSSCEELRGHASDLGAPISHPAMRFLLALTEARWLGHSVGHFARHHTT